MEAKENSVGTLLNGRVQYRVPLFQRQYDWKPENRRQLWSDVLELYEDRSRSKSAQHFIRVSCFGTAWTESSSDSHTHRRATAPNYPSYNACCSPRPYCRV